MTEPLPPSFTSGLESKREASNQVQGANLPGPPARTLAERAHSARLDAHLTQQQVAGKDYTKSYISAIERGKLTPSLQALTVLAERLGVPVSALLGEHAGDRDVPEARRIPLPASHTLALLTLDEAEGYLWQSRPAPALRLLHAPGAWSETLPMLERPRWYRCAGWALLQQEAGHAALAVLEQGLRLAELLHRSAPLPHQGLLAEEGEWLRLFVGQCYTLLGLPEVALEHHRRGIHAWRARVITNPALALRLYQAFCQEALALGLIQDILECYQDASQVAGQLEELHQQGRAYWELALATRARGALPHATRYFQRALMGWTSLEMQRLKTDLHALVDHARSHQTTRTTELPRHRTQHPPIYRFFARPHQDSTYQPEAHLCHLCHRRRPGYAGPFLGDQAVEWVCEACLIAGRLAAVGLRTNIGDQYALREQLRQRYPAWTTEAVAAQVQQQNMEVETRTPPLLTWQPWMWPAHCGEYCRLLQVDGQPGTSGALLPGTSSTGGLVGEGAVVGVYLFACLHCGQALLLWDERTEEAPAPLRERF